jgi:hypothetical protein
VRLRAKRRWGELLPKKEQGERTDLQPLTNGKKSNADQVAEHRARKLAAIEEAAHFARVADLSTRFAALCSAGSGGTPFSQEYPSQYLHWEVAA